MLKTLTAQQLSIDLNPQALGFTDTSELTGRLTGTAENNIRWIGQSSAQQAAEFGLAMQHPGFHLLVLGDAGSGRTSLMLNAMQQAAALRSPAPDLILVFHFETPEKLMPFYIRAGKGAALRAEMEALVRILGKTLSGLLIDPGNDGSDGKVQSSGVKTLSETARDSIVHLLDSHMVKLNSLADDVVIASVQFKSYLSAMKRDVLENIDFFQPTAETEGLLESFLSRYRINLLVDNRILALDGSNMAGAPVVYDDDPSFQSLFGGYEGSGDSAAGIADFMRLRAGNLLRAHGGMLMLHLRDILADQQNGSQILEKLYRVLRNQSVQIEESGGAANQNTASHFAPEALALDVKLVLIATRDEYYELHDDNPDFAKYFRVKVDFSDHFEANLSNYQAIAQFIANQCSTYQIKHFTAAAVAQLIWVMQRRIDDQTRVSTNFSHLQYLLFECAAYATANDHRLVEADDVKAALEARHARYQQPERQLRESIIDGELMISVTGHAVGQINALTHIDVGDAYFGSPVRVSARCFAGKEGVINIDREVEMTGPNHDKGLFILRSWLSANFSQLTPLSLTASLVFEQEYHGVEGDSASCAELFALLSALSDLSLPQGIAVTGALNQHGEVMAIGGINEKIEGFFHLCQQQGLDGTQGVMIPSCNQSHLMLEQAVIDAVEQRLFHIIVVDSVLDGAAYLTAGNLGLGGAAIANEQPESGLANITNTSVSNESRENLMSRVQAKLEHFRESYQANRQHKSH